MNRRGASSRISGGDDQGAAGSGRKGNPCYKVAEDLADWCSSVLWKADLVSVSLGYLAEHFF